MNNYIAKNLKIEITNHHLQAQAAADTAIKHALEAGKLLIEAKEVCNHGDWLPFLESIDINPRTCQRYMRLAKNEHLLINDSVSHLSVTQSLEYLSSKKPGPVKFDGGPPLIDFGISGLSNNAQLSTILKDGGIVFITPSSKDPEFYFVEKLHGCDFVEGWKRPVAGDAVRCCLDVLGVSCTLWSMDKKTTDEPIFMDMRRDDRTRYGALEEMGIVPVDE